MNKENYFIVTVIFLAVIALIALIVPRDEKIVYQSMDYTETKETEKTAEPEQLAEEIKLTTLVYFYNDGSRFHIESGCNGIDNALPGRPCKTALDMGLKPCESCMKNYVIKD